MLEVLQPAGAATGTIGLYILHPGTSGTIYGLQAIVNGTAATHYAGYFQSINATNNYSVVVPSGGGFAGIGTISPTAQLTIVSPDNGVENIFQVYPQNLTQGVGTGYNYIREIGSNGNNTMSIDARVPDIYCCSSRETGCVGIGTTNPAQGKLWVQDGDIWITGNQRLAFSTDESTDNTPNVSIRANGNNTFFTNWSGSSYLDRMMIQG